MRDHLLAPEDDVPVQHAELRQQRGELVPDEGRESARVVGFVGRLLHALPGRARVFETRGQAVGTHTRRPWRRPQHATLERRPEAFVLIHGPAHPFAQVRAIQRPAFRAGMDRVEPLGVVRQRDEVERRRQPGLDSVRQLHRLTAREPISVPRTDAIAEAVGVGGQARVHVEVTEQDPT